MSTVSFHIANLLEKMTSNDKDFRFMATNDLMSELQKDSIKLDDDSERKVVRMLLKLLEDKNGEVQNLAVKCLGPLVDKVKEPQVETIVDTLCTNMTGDKEQLRDISSIGLKTVITELPLTSQQLANVICKKIIGKLTLAISKQEDVTVQLEALDILGDLLSRFGSILQQYHAMLLEALLPQLSSNRQAVRKRTVVALGYLAASCSSAHYSKMVTILVEEMKKGLESNPLQANTQIQCCATVCKNSGSRFAEYLDQVVVMLMNACNKNDDDELKENTLQAFEVFVSRCPQELGTGDHLQGILLLCVKLISHDPNYNDEDQNNFNPMNEESMDCDDEDDDLQNDQDDQEEDEYSDDDDMSWKVRRAAAKCIEAVITSRPDLLLFVYKNVSIPLILRFREREENVRCDVFSAYRSLLRATKPAVLALNEARLTGLPPSNQSLMAVQSLENQIPQLVKIVQKQLKEKNIKSRQVALQVLAELVNVLPGCLSSYLATMMNGILTCLSDRNSTSNVRTNTLSFLYVIMSSHPIKVIQPHVQALLPVLLNCVGDNFYKVTSEALSTLQVLIKIIRSAEPGAVEHQNASQLTREIYPVVLHRLKATDIDQEVKETAITTTATLLAHLGNYIQSEWQNCIPIFLERLKNEITRLTAVKALNLMASSKLVDLDLRSVLSEAIPVLSSFLRKNQRALKLVTLNLIDTLMIRYGPMDAMLLENVIQELPSLLSESDLHCAQQALQLMTSLAIYQPHVVERAATVCLPSIKVLVRSPLMQGAALNALMQFLQALVKANIATFTSQRLLAIFLEQEVASSPTKDLLGAVHHKQSFYSLAKCISVISVGSGDQDALNVANGFVRDLSKLNTLTDTQVVIALLSIGEIGRRIDLSQLQQLRETILQCFSHSSEEVKTAAAHSFGSVAIGNLPFFLPALLNEMKQQPKKQYLLLHALKEIISAQHGVNISNWTEDIWTALFAHAECSEEGTRNVVAECLGRLTLASPEKFLPRLKNALQSHSNLLRTTSISAVKFTIVDQPQMIDPILKETIGDFLKSLSDPDLNVRRVALVAFNSAAHNKPALIRDLLPELLPQLYIETQIRKELIREVEMGPFRHSVDDGLDLRKAAFECMYTLLDSCLDRLDIRDFLTNVENGLRDHYDIKMLTYLMVARLAALCPSHVVQRLDRLIEPLKNTVTLKVKANSVKQEYEKQDELKRAALRAVSALSSIPDADKHIQLMEFVAHIRNNQDLQTLYDSVQSDSLSSANNNDVHMNID